MITLTFDGGAVNGVGCGAYILAVDGKPYSPRRHQFTGDGSWLTITGNVTEYVGMTDGLASVVHYVKDKGPDSILVRGDSELVICQMTGEYRVKSPNLKQLYRLASSQVHMLERLGCSVNFQWIPREQNSQADEFSKVQFG